MSTVVNDRDLILENAASRFASTGALANLGYVGALNATANFFSQGLQANRPIGNNGDMYYATDNSTLYQMVSGGWAVVSTVGAPAGTLVAGTDAGTVVSNAATALYNANAAKDSATAANTAIGYITSDNYLSMGEKSAVIADWTVIQSEKDGIIANANTVGISHSDYDSAYTVLSNYLGNLTNPAWNDVTKDTPIVGATFRTNFANYYSAKQTLLNNIAAKASTMASGVTISSNGALSGAGGGQVTIGGLGYTGHLGATKNIITSGTTAPANPSDGDVWINTGTPVVINTRVSGAWVAGGNIATSLSQVDTSAATKLAGVATGATANVVSTGTGAPAAASGNNGDFYYSTDTHILYQKVTGTWTQCANNYTNTNQLTDGAGLGTTALWTNIAGQANAPASNATVGADATNLNVGLGGKNLIPHNSLPSDGSIYSGGGGAGYSMGYVGPGDLSGWATYSPNAKGCVYMHVAGTPPASQLADLYMPVRITVTAGTRYEAGVTLSTHRCLGRVLIAWYDSNNKEITEAWGNPVDNQQWSTSWQGAAPRSVLTMNAPAGAVMAMIFVRQYHTGVDNDCFTFASQWYFGEALPNQTVGSPWAPSPTETLDILAAISNDNVLSKGEKSAANAEWLAIYNERGGVVTQAGNLGVDSSDYTAKFNTLQSYLVAMGTFSDYTSDTTILGSDFRSNFANYYTAKQALINAIAAKAATMASGVTLSSSGALIGAGGGQVETLPVKDGARTVNYAPRDYGVVHVKEFKQCSSIGISTSAIWCTLETMKPWLDSSGGNATQWAYISSTEIWKRSGGCGDAAWGDWIRDLDRSLFTGDLNATAGATWGVNVSGAPQDVSNLVKKSSINDGLGGGWTAAQGVESIVGTNASAVPYTAAIVTRTRDCLETDNYFSVSPGETLFYDVWLNSEATSLQSSFGVIFYDKNGQFAGTSGIPYLGAGSPWVHSTGYGTVPVNAATAVPWIWQNGDVASGDFNGKNWLRAAGMWIGRHARGATVGATLGVNVNGTASSLSTLSNTIGTYSSTGSGSGGHMIFGDAVIKIYDSTSLRMEMGDESL